VVSADGKYANQFDIEEGARSLANFLKASVDEMAVGARALGKGALREVNRKDLVALDPAIAQLAGVPLASEIPEETDMTGRAGHPVLAPPEQA
jgi:hypothetical protein